MATDGATTRSMSAIPSAAASLMPRAEGKDGKTRCDQGQPELRPDPAVPGQAPWSAERESKAREQCQQGDRHDQPVTEDFHGAGGRPGGFGVTVFFFLNRKRS